MCNIKFKYLRLMSIIRAEIFTSNRGLCGTVLREKMNVIIEAQEIHSCGNKSGYLLAK